MFATSCANTDVLSCTTSDSQHYLRHKEMLIIYREIEKYDTEARPQNPGTRRSSNENIDRWRRGSVATSTGSSEALDEANESITILTQRQRKRAARAGRPVRSHKFNVDVVTQFDIDFISEALHGVVHDGKGAWMSNTNIHNNQPSTSQLASLVHDNAESDEDQESYTSPVTSKTQKKGRSYASTSTQAREEVVKAKKAPEKTTKLFRKSSKYSKAKSEANTDPYQGVSPSILQRLGLELDYPGASKARREALSKLLCLVKLDFETIHNEEEETCIRQEGFRRYVGKKAYGVVQANREDIDWITGQRKKKSRNSDASNDPVEVAAPIPEEDNENQAEDAERPDNDDTEDAELENSLPTEEHGKSGEY